MKVAEIIEKFEPLERDLEKTGMAVNIYKQPPVRKDIYTMSVTQRADAFRFWPGIAEIEKSTNKKHRQAVLTVHEDRRTISELVVVGPNVQAKNNVRVRVPKARFTYDTLLTITEKDIADAAKLRPISPYTRHYISTEEVHSLYDTGDWKIPSGNLGMTWRVGSRVVEIHQHAPETNTSFLVGMDETAHFICQLPQVVDTVDEAHDVLKPEEAQDRSDWKRQGEWFFIPVTDKALRDELTAKLSPRRAFATQLEWDSSHNVMHVRHNKERYGIGVVIDNRRGHHENVLLNDWHKIVRNREVVQTNVHTQTRTYWD